MKSLHLRIVLVFSAIILVSGILLSYVPYKSSEKLVVNSLGRQAKTVAEAAVGLIDTDRYKELSPEQGETPYYYELRARMNEMRETNGLKYLYTMAVRETAEGSEYYYVVDGAPEDVSEDDFSPMGQVEEGEFLSLPKAFETKQTTIGELTKMEPYGATITSYVPILDENGVMLGVMGADFDATEVYDLLENNRSRTIWTSGIVILLSLALIYGFARFIVIPLKRMAREMQQVQAGDLTVNVTVKGKDEVARLAAGFSQMLGDLRTMIAGIKSSTDLLHQSAKSLASDVAVTEQTADHIARRIGEAAANAGVQQDAASETARAMEEVGSGVQRVAESSSVVAEASQAATDAAKAGDSSVLQAVDQMEAIFASSQEVAEDIKRLEERSGEVGEIVETMREIAGQTNLLALNAAIEAARAGEAGRGFAVVADQVRKLAVQSETSGARIDQLIRHMQTDTGKAVEAVDKESGEVKKGLAEIRAVGDMFHHILNQVERVAEQVEEVSAVSEEIAAAAEEVTASVEEISRMSKLTADLTSDISSATHEQSDALAHTMKSSAELNRMAFELDALAERFKV